MAYPASTTPLQVALSSADAMAIKVKSYATQLRDRSVAGPVGRQAVVDFVGVLDRAVSNWNATSALAGIGAFTQAQKGSPTLDVAAEFTSMVTQAVSLRDWIVSAFPKDASSGAALIWAYDASGNPTELTFTTLQLAQFRTKADALIATIA